MDDPFEDIAREALQAEIMDYLRQGLIDGPDFEDDWASWEEFVAGLFSLVVGTDEGDVMGAIISRTWNQHPLRDECWKVIVNDEKDWDLTALLKAFPRKFVN
ncbi:MAG: hypothetical protein KJ622_03725 [Alphaproteobacteria bacterium]|nr:hypothetical protein [Alphaproteobacteria bacterium]